MSDSRSARIGLAIALVSISLSSAPPALAQEDAGKLRDEAKKLLASGKVAEACDKFAASQQASPKPEVLFELAQCHDKQGKAAAAVAEYKEASPQLRQARLYDKEKAAKTRIMVLEAKLPKVTVTVAGKAEGQEVTIDGTALPEAAWGKPQALEAGEHMVASRAPNKKTFESRVVVKGGEKKTVAIAALADDKAAGAAAAAPAAPAKPAAKPEAKPEPKPAPAAATKAEPTPPPPEPPAKADERKAGRPVIEVGPFAAFLLADFDTADLSGVQGLPYQLEKPGGLVLNQECNDISPCEAHFSTEVGLLIGGEAFVGWAFLPSFHLGARGFGAARLKGGWMFVGGPAFTFEPIDKLWFGASFLVGGVRQQAGVEEIRAPVPEADRPLNGDEVIVPPSPNTPADADVGSGFALGGNLEVSYALLPTSLGSLMVGAWPMFLKGGNGWALAVPVGLAFKFH